MNERAYTSFSRFSRAIISRGEVCERVRLSRINIARLPLKFSTVLWWYKRCSAARVYAYAPFIGFRK